MRTKDEINRQIKGLKKEKEDLPEFSMFGTNNWKSINAMIEILNGNKSSEHFEFADQEVENAAYDAENWLNEERDDDLFGE